MSHDPRLPHREYPFAHELREGLNRSHRRLDQLNLVQLLLGALGFILCLLALWL